MFGIYRTREGFETHSLLVKFRSTVSINCIYCRCWFIFKLHRYNRVHAGVGTDFSPVPSVCLSVSQSVKWVNCGKTADWIWMPFGVVSEVGWGMGVINGGPYPQGKGRFMFFWGGGWCWFVSMGFAMASTTEKCIQFMWENLIRFPFGQYIIGNVCLLAFWRCS